MESYYNIGKLHLPNVLNGAAAVMDIETTLISFYLYEFVKQSLLFSILTRILKRKLQTILSQNSKSEKSLKCFKILLLEIISMNAF